MSSLQDMGGIERRLLPLFALLVGLGAIFVDAVIAHGLFWENDPYWTYWITKTFLIMTVFGLGTALVGAGLWQGLGLTAAHTLVLEVYYDWFAPVGLPQEPEWLDFNHLWITGVPAHFLAILGGYLGALWIWRRNGLPERLGTADARGAVSIALLATVLVLVFDALLTHGLIFRSFPGYTYFIQHLLVTFVLLLFWAVYVGFDVVGWLVGALMLSLTWIAYGIYLAPTGLPQEVRYLGYEDLWARAFPGALVSALAGIFLASRLLKAKLHPLGAVVLLLGLPVAASAQGLPASASASGHCMQVVGSDPVDMNSTIAGEGSIQVRTIEKGNRWSHVQNKDEMSVSARWTSGGSVWQVEISETMPRHPLGKYTVWNGVVYRHEMHGHTGIGTAKLPLMRPEIALWGWARVTRDGQEIARMAPAHVMVTSTGPMRGIMLEVDSEDKALVGAPHGYLTVMWHEIEALQMPDSEEQRRKIYGWIGMVALPLLFWWCAARERRVAQNPAVE
jgi:hypothetical protein